MPKTHFLSPSLLFSVLNCLVISEHPIPWIWEKAFGTLFNTLRRRRYARQNASLAAVVDVDASGLIPQRKWVNLQDGRRKKISARWHPNGLTILANPSLAKAVGSLNSWVLVFVSPLFYYSSELEQTWKQAYGKALFFMLYYGTLILLQLSKVMKSQEKDNFIIRWCSDAGVNLIASFSE